MDENRPGLKRRNAERDLIPPTARMLKPDEDENRPGLMRMNAERDLRPPTARMLKQDEDENRPGLKRMNAERDLRPPSAGGNRRGKTLKRRKAELSQSGGEREIVNEITIEERISNIERDIASIRKQISDFTGVGTRLRIDDRVQSEKNKVLYRKADILGIDRKKYAHENDFANSVNLSWYKYEKKIRGGEKSKKKLTKKKKLTLKKKL